MNSQRLTFSAAAVLFKSIDERVAFIKSQVFIPYPAGLAALKWLRYVRQHEYGRDRPRSVHIVGVGGMGKSRLLKHYTSLNGPQGRTSEGNVSYPVILVEAPEDGSYVKLCQRIIEACIPGYSPSKLAPYVNAIERYLDSSGVRQVLIDEAGNLLLANRTAQQQCLAFIKRITNAGVTVGIATTENMKNVFAADEQLYSRFRQIQLPKWQESTELRIFLAGVEQQLPLPEPSGLDSIRVVRWLLAKQYDVTGSIIQVMRDATQMAIRTERSSITVDLLEEAANRVLPPDEPCE